MDPPGRCEDPDTCKIKSAILGAVTLLFQILPVRSLEDDRRRGVRDIELGMVQPVVFNEEDRDANETDQWTTADLQLDQSTFTSNSEFAIRVTVALVLAGGSFGVMHQVPGGVNELGRAVLGDSIGFNVFLVADTLTLLASLLVVMIVVTMSHRSAKVERFIGITVLRFDVPCIRICDGIPQS